MKVGIMQPYFVPYIGYWQLMNAVDMYVVYDDVNYINRGWINRNRILVEGQPKYFNVPMTGASQNKRIFEVKVNHDSKLIEKNLRMIECAYRRAPFYQEVYDLLEKILYCGKNDLGSYIMCSFHTICAYLKIETELIFSSSLDKNNDLRGKDKIISICELLKATEYYNAIGGKELYSKEEFGERGIALRFVRTDKIEYPQFGNEFQPNLSIIDVMMFNSVERIQEMLSMYTLE